MTLSIRDSVTMSEGCSHPDISRSVSDSVSPSGIIWHYGESPILRNISDTVSTEEIKSQTFFSPKDVGESVSFADQKNNQVTDDPSYDEQTNISEAVSATPIDDKVASDSINFSSDSVETVSLNIVSPTTLSQYVLKDPVIFTGIAVNLLTGQSIDDSLVKWISDKDGLIGYGKTFQFAHLTIGTHVISFTATGFPGVKFITITVIDDTVSSRPENLDEE